ncbi:predicted protein [Sclerotinia sclerotiorum 1980 UF-70]|uniref:Uncharacterized protein n=1 Tax=Sclerotinia sclerotiorum (strain ATCC 18683 / 1980 / Ss-1) TaxID=665079 RepID=A7EYD8_SCLS1|nr:predicted protein [Sclerotinia sclerotiorum 1980 UF-70]EDN94480.1 predicted protein [Sclerotinia sclerotiorum 1980 UF-70]
MPLRIEGVPIRCHLVTGRLYGWDHVRWFHRHNRVLVLCRILVKEQRGPSHLWSSP